MKSLFYIAVLATPAVALAQAPAPATAPAASAAPTVGATVTGKDNQPAGTVAQVTAEAIVIDTGTNKVPVPPTAIGAGAKGPTIAMTKAELDAAYAQAAQQAQANLDLSPGKMVHGLNNAMLGTIKSSDAQFVTITTPKGEVKLPRSAFAPGTGNTVRVGATKEQVDAAVAGAGGASTTTSSSSTTTAPATGDTTTTEQTTTTTDATATDPAATTTTQTKTKTKKPKAN